MVRACVSHHNVWQCAVCPEKKGPECRIISWVDNSMEKLRPTGKTLPRPGGHCSLFTANSPEATGVERVTTLVKHLKKKKKITITNKLPAQLKVDRHENLHTVYLLFKK